MATNIETIIKNEVLNIAKKIVSSDKCKTAVGRAYLDIVEQNFESEGRPKWKAWSASYAKWRAKQPYPLKIGTMTGAMRNSMRAESTGFGVRVGSQGISYTGYFDVNRKIFTYPNGSSQIISTYIMNAF